MDHEKNIEQKATEAFNHLNSPERLKASDDFFAKVQAKIDTAPKQATIYSFTWKDTMKYAALLAIMVLNGILLFQVTSLDGTTAELGEEDVTTLVDEFFPDYYTVNED